MRHLLRSVLALSAISLSIAAHADTFAGSVSFTDTSSKNNAFDFAGSFQNPSFSFSGGVGSTYYDQLTITTTDGSCTGHGHCSADNDNLSITVSFTSPNAAAMGFNGTGTESLQFFAFFPYNDSSINWSSNSQIVNFADGSSVQVSLPDFDFTGGFDGSYSGTENVKFQVVTAPVAATPEPSSFLLLGTGLIGVGTSIRRKMGL